MGQVPRFPAVGKGLNQGFPEMPHLQEAIIGRAATEAEAPALWPPDVDR